MTTAPQLELLERTADLLTRLTRDLPRATITWRQEPAEFSILENLWHLHDIEVEGHLVRIRRLIEETHPVLPDLDGAKLAIERAYNTLDAMRAIECFREARRAGLELLRGADAQDMERAGELETVGPISLRDLTHRMVEHDRGHVADIESLLRRLPQA
jgi:DinB family protein